MFARSYVLARLPSGLPRVPFEEAAQLAKSRLPASALERPGTTIKLIEDCIFVEHDRAVHERVEAILAEELGVIESTTRPSTDAVKHSQGIGGGVSPTQCRP